MNATRKKRFEFPDEDLKNRVASFLNSRHFPAFRCLDIEVDNGAVTISGEVCTYYEKQVALTTCQRVAGVLSMIDQIAVEPNDQDVVIRPR